MVESAITRCPNLRQVSERLVNRNHVAVLGVYVVEVRVVGVGVAVAYCFGGDYGTKAVLEGVDGGRPDAARGRCAGDYEGVHTGGGEQGSERRAEEARGEELVQDRFRLFGSIRGSISAQRVPACRVRSAGTLS